MAVLMMDNLRELQKNYSEVLDKYQMTTDVNRSFGGYIVGGCFKSLCRFHDELLASKAMNEPWQNAIGRLYKHDQDSDDRVDIFNMQAKLFLAKAMYPEQKTMIEVYADGMTKANLETFISEGNLSTVVAFKDIYQPMLDAFKDEKLQDIAPEFQLLTEVAEETINSFSPYEEVLQQAEDSIDKIRGQERTEKAAYDLKMKEFGSQKDDVINNLLNNLSETQTVSADSTETQA